MTEESEILQALSKKRDALLEQADAIAHAMKSLKVIFHTPAEAIEVPKIAVAPKIAMEEPTITNPEYKIDLTMDAKVYVILKELKQATTSEIVENIKQKEPKIDTKNLTRDVTMCVSRLLTIGNTNIIPTKNGKIKAKPHPTHGKKKIYFI